MIPEASKRHLVWPILGAVITALLLGFALVGGLTKATDWYPWWPHVSMSEIKRVIDAAVAGRTTTNSLRTHHLPNAIDT
jgi:hypothetical protein